MNTTSRYSTLVLLAILVPLVMLSCERRHDRSGDWGHANDGWIGVYVQDLDSELRNYLDWDERDGVLVNQVVDDGPADDAGLRDEDVIVKFDGNRIRRSRDLTRAVQRKSPGDRVRVEIVRNGRKKQLRLRIGEREQRSYTSVRPDRRNRKVRPDRQDRKVTPDRRDREARPDRQESKARPGREPRPYAYSVNPNRQAWLGVRLAELNDDLAEYFDVGRRDGVLVLSVEEDSPAEAAGFKGGDIIAEIENERVRTPQEVIDAISGREVGETVEVQIKRKGRRRTISIELGRAPSSFNFNFNFAPEMRREWWNDSRRHEELGDKLRDLRDRIKTEVRDKIHHDARIRNRIEIRNLHEHLETASRLAQEEVEREMERVREELERVRIEIQR